MASASYSFLDIVVLDEVRERFAAGEALAVLSLDLREILWANGTGAAWLGYVDVETAIGARPALSAVALRQIAAAPGFPNLERDQNLILRMTQGVKSRTLALTARTITLPSGERALLLALPSVGDDAKTFEQAGRIVAGFKEPGNFAALIEADGSVAAASAGFESLGFGADTLERLVRDVQKEDDRLVKKLVETARGRLPAGIARLTDNPARHLLVIVNMSIPSSQPVSEEGPARPPERISLAQEPSGTNQRTVQDTPTTPAAQEAKDLAARETPPAQRSVRFSWRTDAEGRFSALSEEFAKAVGEPAADILGRSFREVSNVFDLDPAGDVIRMLERRDTWSGRTVMWPISGTSLRAPVDLAGLPVYGRERNFEGFRGFGIVRLEEAEADPEAIGLVLVSPCPQDAANDAQTLEARASTGMAKGKAPSDMPSEAFVPEEDAEPEGDPFLGEKPAIILSEADDEQDDENSKVIHLDEHRENGRGGLTSSERNAFREIGERLRRANEALAKQSEASGEAAMPREGDVADHENGNRPSLDRDLSNNEQGEPRQPDPLAQSDQPIPAEDPNDPADEKFAEEAAEQNALAPNVQGPRGEEPAQKTFHAGDEASTGVGGHIDFIPSAFYHPEPASTDDQPEQAFTNEAISSVLSALPVPVLIHSGDRLHYANPEFYRFSGYKSLAELESAGGIGALFVQSSQTDGRETLQLRTASGGNILVEAHLQSIPWMGGKALMLSLRRPQEAPDRIAELEARLSEMNAVLDTATDGVVVMAADGTIRSINQPAEALFGFDAEHVIGQQFTSLFAIESQHTVKEYLAALSDNGVASVLNDGRQVIGREAQGRFIPLFITIGRLSSGNGYCAVLRDITHWKRAEEELTQARAQAERASSQKSDFLARVSHEIRTPLNAIIGFSELMVDEKFGPIGNDRYRDYLRDINRSGNHVLELVNDLLDISKIEAGQQEMSYEAVSLNETLSQVVAMMQPQANSERVIIRSSFASRLPDVVADPRSVRQIAINLLSNAVRYTPAGGQVIISTAYEKDGSVAMRLRDTGDGMSSAELDEAMKPFKQLNRLRRKHRGDGTGLGLPLTRAMVEANRAQFSISSTPGEGTLVEISFPPTRVLAS